MVKFNQIFPAFALMLILVPVIVTTSCRQEEGISPNIRVAVTVLPQTEFVESVGGERVHITVMVPPGANLHAYEPTPSQMTRLTKAEMYVKVGSGVEFELTWMDKLANLNKDMLIVDSSRGIQLPETAVGQEGEESGHSAMDPHIWMSPLNVKIMVQNIYEGLVQVDPENKAYYEQNRNAYIKKLTELDRDIRNSLAGITNRTFMVYHPAFGYFAREYNLTMLPIEVEGKEPTAAGLIRLIEQAREHKIKVIFTSPQFNPESAEVIADALDGRIVFIDPLARDYVVNMRNLLSELVETME